MVRSCKCFSRASKMSTRQILILIRQNNLENQLKEIRNHSKKNKQTWLVIINPLTEMLKIVVKVQICHLIIKKIHNLLNKI